MIGLLRSRRWAQWLAALMVATIGLFAVAVPARAADTGTIKGGVFIVDVKGSKIKINDKNSKFTLAPTANGAQIAISDGRIQATNVPVGSYTATLTFKLTRDACPGLLQGISIIGGVLTSPLTLFCSSSIRDSYYAFTKTWTVTVTNGGTTFLEGDSDNGDKVLGNAVQTTASGNPIVDCSGKGILMSFVVCPAIENTLGILDWIMDNFIQPYLSINPLTTSNQDGTPSVLYTVWNNIRNFANIIFIGLFFVIVFSQATSIGISNYGIKRLLPRLVLIAIGTNISFFICAFMVDFSNILGAGIASLLVTSVINGSPQVIIGSDLFNILFAAGPFGAAATLFAQGALTAAIIFGLFIFLLFALFMLFIAAVVVLLRQVVIIFMVLASPLAFVAGLLPNTQRMFSQWFVVFARLLMMYPIMMGLLAAAKIASTVLNQIGQ